jgi:hypothetical protein
MASISRRDFLKGSAADNHLQSWKALEELGSDPFPYSANRAPSLRFAQVQFSGI